MPKILSKQTCDISKTEYDDYIINLSDYVAAGDGIYFLMDLGQQVAGIQVNGAELVVSLCCSETVSLYGTANLEKFILSSKSEVLLDANLGVTQEAQINCPSLVIRMPLQVDGLLRIDVDQAVAVKSAVDADNLVLRAELLELLPEGELRLKDSDLKLSSLLNNGGVIQLNTGLLHTNVIDHRQGCFTAGDKASIQCDKAVIGAGEFNLLNARIMRCELKLMVMPKATFIAKNTQIYAEAYLGFYGQVTLTSSPCFTGLLESSEGTLTLEGTSESPLQVAAADKNSICEIIVMGEGSSWSHCNLFVNRFVCHKAIAKLAHVAINAECGEVKLRLAQGEYSHVVVKTDSLDLMTLSAEAVATFTHSQIFIRSLAIAGSVNMAKDTLVVRGTVVKKKKAEVANEANESEFEIQPYSLAYDRSDLIEGVLTFSNGAKWVSQGYVYGENSSQIALKSDSSVNLGPLCTSGGLSAKSAEMGVANLLHMGGNFSVDDALVVVRDFCALSGEAAKLVKAAKLACKNLLLETSLVQSGAEAAEGEVAVIQVTEALVVATGAALTSEQASVQIGRGVVAGEVSLTEAQLSAKEDLALAENAKMELSQSGLLVEEGELFVASQAELSIKNGSQVKVEDIDCHGAFSANQSLVEASEGINFSHTSHLTSAASQVKAKRLVGAGKVTTQKCMVKNKEGEEEAVPTQFDFSESILFEYGLEVDGDGGLSLDSDYFENNGNIDLQADFVAKGGGCLNVGVIHSTENTYLGFDRHVFNLFGTLSADQNVTVSTSLACNFGWINARGSYVENSLASVNMGLRTATTSSVNSLFSCNVGLNLPNIPTKASLNPLKNPMYYLGAGRALASNFLPGSVSKYANLATSLPMALKSAYGFAQRARRKGFSGVKEMRWHEWIEETAQVKNVAMSFASVHAAGKNLKKDMPVRKFNLGTTMKDVAMSFAGSNMNDSLFSFDGGLTCAANINRNTLAHVNTGVSFSGSYTVSGLWAANHGSVIADNVSYNVQQLELTGNLAASNIQVEAETFRNRGKVYFRNSMSVDVDEYVEAPTAHVSSDTAQRSVAMLPTGSGALRIKAKKADLQGSTDVNGESHDIAEYVGKNFGHQELINGTALPNRQVATSWGVAIKEKITITFDVDDTRDISITANGVTWGQEVNRQHNINLTATHGEAIIARNLLAPNIGIDASGDISNQARLVAQQAMFVRSENGDFNNLGGHVEGVHVEISANEIRNIAFNSQVAANFSQHSMGSNFATIKATGANSLFLRARKGNIENHAGLICGEHANLWAAQDILNKVTLSVDSFGRVTYRKSQIQGGKGEAYQGVGVYAYAGNKIICDASGISSQGDNVLIGKKGVELNERHQVFLDTQGQQSKRECWYSKKITETSEELFYQPSLVTSKHGKNIISAPDGTVKGTAAIFKSKQGTHLLTKFAPELHGFKYSLKTQTETSPGLAYWWSGSETGESEYFMPTIAADGGVTALEYTQGNVNFKEVLFSGSGDVIVNGNKQGSAVFGRVPLTYSQKSSRVGADIKVGSFSVARALEHLCEGEWDSDLLNVDPTVGRFSQAVNTCKNRQDGLERAAVVSNAAVSGFNALAVLMKGAADGTVGQDLLERYGLGGKDGLDPRLGCDVCYESSDTAGQRYAMTGIRGRRDLIVSAEELRLEDGVQLQVSRDVLLQHVRRLILSAGSVNSHTRRLRVSGGGSGQIIAMTGELHADINRSINQQQSYENALLSVGRNIYFGPHLDALEMTGGNIEAESAFGHIEQADLVTLRGFSGRSDVSGGVSVSASPSVRAFSGSGSSRRIAERTGIHLRTPLNMGETTLTFGDLRMQGSSLTSAGRLRLVARTVNGQSVSEFEQYNGFGVELSWATLRALGNMLLGRANSGSSQEPVQTLPITWVKRDYRATQHSVIAGEDGPAILEVENVSGHVHTDDMDGLVVHEDVDRNMRFEAPITSLTRLTQAGQDIAQGAEAIHDGVSRRLSSLASAWKNTRQARYVVEVDADGRQVLTPLADFVDKYGKKYAIKMLKPLLKQGLYVLKSQLPALKPFLAILKKKIVIISNVLTTKEKTLIGQVGDVSLSSLIDIKTWALVAQCLGATTTAGVYFTGAVASALNKYLDNEAEFCRVIHEYKKFKEEVANRSSVHWSGGKEEIMELFSQCNRDALKEFDFVSEIVRRDILLAAAKLYEFATIHPKEKVWQLVKDVAQFLSAERVPREECLVNSDDFPAFAEPPRLARLRDRLERRPRGYEPGLFTYLRRSKIRSEVFVLEQQARQVREMNQQLEDIGARSGTSQAR